jgi:ribosome-binding protein aMBF1 (putative translation factor)
MSGRKKTKPTSHVFPAAGAPSNSTRRRKARSSSRIAPLWMEVQRTVARNVRQLRMAAGLSQDELAERMKIGCGYLRELELGQCNATIFMLATTG